jgi:hypothetical protein
MNATAAAFVLILWKEPKTITAAVSRHSDTPHTSENPANQGSSG